MLEVQYVTFVQRLFAFFSALSFQGRLSFSAAAFLALCANGGER